MKSSQVDRRVRAAALFFLQPLESRCLLSAAVVSQIPTQSVLASATGTIDLTTFLADTSIPAGDTVVDIQTNLPAPDNSIPIELTNAATPNTVANFLQYITSGEYSGTIVHRSVPNFIVQGGGFTPDGNAISTFGTVNGESSTATLLNATPGTIAMALVGGTGSADSGTDQWFINLTDNSFLDTNENSQGPFTAFGQTIYGGLTAATDIGNLGEVDASAQNGAWNTLPVNSSYTGATAVPPATIPTATDPVPTPDFVTTNPVIVPAGVIYTAVSADPSVMGVSIANGVLTMTPGTNVTTGSTTIMVTATDLGGGVVTSSFTANVTDSHLTIAQQPTNTKAGSTLAPVVVDIDNSSNTVDTSDDSDVTIALSNGTLGGTTTVAAVNGVATFSDLVVAAPGTYTLTASTSSALAATSNSFDVTPVVNIGAGGAKSVSYTDADGTLATVTLRGPGAASVDFAGTGLTQSGVTKVLVSGAAPTISSITTTGTTAASTLVITTVRGTRSISIGSITTDSLHAITAPGVTVTGDVISSASIGVVNLASATGGTISAASIGSLATSGVFADTLTLTGGGIVLGKFKAGGITQGTWNITGSINGLTAGAITAWNPIITGSIKALVVNKGDMSNDTLVVGSIGAATVKGNLSNSTLQLTAAGLNLRALKVGGSIATSELNAAGSIGNIAAASLVNSLVYAGIVNLTVGQALPDSAADFVSASIASVKLRNVAGITSFSDSDIASSVIGNLSLGSLLTSNGGNPTGVAAEQGIRLLSGVANTKFALRKLALQSDVTSQVTAQGVVLGDFQVDLFTLLVPA